MYVIATVICPNFHFSVSPHVPFLNLLFEQIAIPTSICLQKSASILPRTSPSKFEGKCNSLFICLLSADDLPTKIAVVVRPDGVSSSAPEQHVDARRELPERTHTVILFRARLCLRAERQKRRRYCHRRLGPHTPNTNIDFLCSRAFTLSTKKVSTPSYKIYVVLTTLDVKCWKKYLFRI